MKKKTRNTLKTVGINLLAVLALIPILFPIYWLVVSGLQNPQSIISIPPKLFPTISRSTFVKKVFTEFGFLRFLLNSVFLSLLATFLTLFVACLAAFSYTAYTYKAKETFSKIILFVHMFPQILFVIPIYLLMSKMHLINTYTGLILCYIAFEMPICVWTMQSYFRTIPKT
jgi:multiple sugar transport system permease protein